MHSRYQNKNKLYICVSLILKTIAKIAFHITTAGIFSELFILIYSANENQNILNYFCAKEIS